MHLECFMHTYTKFWHHPFLQISKLSMVPVLCMLEVLFVNIRYSRDTKLSIIVVLLGVAICTVTDVSLNTKGLIAAAVAVCSTAFQQHVIIDKTRIFTFILWVLVLLQQHQKPGQISCQTKPYLYHALFTLPALTCFHSFVLSF